MPEFPDIPIVAIGPGSQPGRADDGLEYLAMPSGMQTYRRPILPEPEDTTGLRQGKRILAGILQALRRWRPDGPTASLDLGELDQANRAFVDQALGEGEVSVACDGHSPIRAQEAVLAGVWRVQHFDIQARLIRDIVEVGDVPGFVRSASFADADVALDTRCDSGDPAIQNAPALLVELADRLAGYQAADAVHTINLSLLPLSAADLLLLGERMGVGPVTILSRGYGNCRIGSTAKRNAWWIKYFNSQDALILNTIEVTAVPKVALAAAEDIADSALRLDEILEMYR